jgi:hypothetical protein
VNNAQNRLQHSAMQTAPENLIADSIIQSAQQLARSSVHLLSRSLPWLSGASELRNTLEVAFANHFQRQMDEELPLCTSCGSARVNYCEREGPTGVSFDGCSEIRSESGYLCADCGAFEDGVITIHPEVAA